MNNRKKNWILGEKRTGNRIVALYVLCFLVGILFFVRLFQLQVVGGEVYRKEALEQKMKEVEIAPERGVIFDRNKTVLAQNVKMNSLYFLTDNLEEGEKQRIASALSPILQISETEILEKGETSDSKIATGLNMDQVNKIREEVQNGTLSNLWITTENGRFYPNGNLASSVLGFTNIQNNGIYGVESTFNNELRGTPGKTILTKSLKGDFIPGEEGLLYEAKPGEEITLTIDTNIQNMINKYSTEVMNKYSPKKMTVIVMDPNNGEILGLENYPQYNPNKPREPRNEEEASLISDMSEEELTNYYYNVWRSFAINDTYEPGSVFKAITASAALEEGVVSEDKVYECTGTINDIPGVRIRCHRWYDPHGEQTLSEALNNSCNPAFVQIIRDIGKDRFFKYLAGFGFGLKTGIALPGEEKGIVPKDINAIGEAELATMSYGHGISVTPIQMITAMNATINGGYHIVPKITVDEETKEKRQVISQNTSIKMRELLKSVIDDGSGSALSIPGYDLGGKSGTSIKIEDGEYRDDKTDASFYMTYPTESPKYSVLVVVDEPLGENGGNAVAGPVAKNIIKDIIKLNNLPADSNIDEEIAEQNITVPDVTGMTLSQASDVLRDFGLRAMIFNSSTDINMIIEKQNPEAYTKVSPGTSIELVADSTGIAQIKMPNLVGNNSSYGVDVLEGLDIIYELYGDENGNIIKTIPEANTMMDPQSIVKVYIKDESKEDEDSQNDSNHFDENNMESHELEE